MRPIQLPEDELAHRDAIEWWYFHGHLSVGDEELYSFLAVFFKIDIRKTNLLKYVPSRILRWFMPIARGRIAQTHLVDHKNKVYYNATHHMPGIVHTSAFESAKSLDLQYGAAQLRHIEDYLYKVQVTTNHFSLDLALWANKPPLLNGPDNSGIVDFQGGRSYYYSMTNNSIRGTLTLQGEKKEVTGKGWVDHQWGNFDLLKTIWVWFGIQLSDNTEYMLFYIITPDDPRHQKLINVSYPDGTMGAIADYEMTPLASWRSPNTNQSYGTTWHLYFIDKGTKVDLTIEAIVEGQEMNDKKSVPYYEGDCTVTGTRDSTPVKGHAYMEIMNYDLKWLERSIKENSKL